MSLTDDSLFAGRFRLGPLLGSGGSSSVYRSIDTISGSPVAVKVLHPHLCQTADARAAFLREAERLAAVGHPNIARVVAVGIADVGEVLMAWIALELIEGPSLSALVGERGALAVEAAAEITIGILNGLAAAHRAGLVHRDIAPHNILLTQAGDDLRADQVRLIDFGLADQSGRSTVGTDPLLSAPAGEAVSSVVGSVAYLSPEQAMGRPVTAAGDLYQVGGVLYFLLTGGPPYPRPTALATLRAQVIAPPPVPSALMPGVRSLDHVVTTAMAKQPADRFADAAAFRDAVVRATRSASVPLTRTRVLPSASLLAAGPLPPSSTLDYLQPASTMPSPPPGRPGQHPRHGPRQRPSAAVPIAVTTLVAVAIIGVFSASAAGGSVHPLPSPSPSPSSSSRPTATPSPTPAATVEVPALSGTLTDAEAALNACGLAVGHITKVPSNQPASTVLGQTPRTGTAVVVGSRVDVRIASGSNVVPDVTNLTVADALARLRAAGFQAAGPADYPDDALVTGSRPAANVLFPLGATVLVTVVGQDGGLRSPTPSESPSG